MLRDRQFEADVVLGALFKWPKISAAFCLTHLECVLSIQQQRWSPTYHTQVLNRGLRGQNTFMSILEVVPSVILLTGTYSCGTTNYLGCRVMQFYLHWMLSKEDMQLRLHRSVPASC